MNKKILRISLIIVLVTIIFNSCKLDEEKVVINLKKELPEEERVIGPLELCGELCNQTHMWGNNGNWRPEWGCVESTFIPKQFSVQWQEGWWESEYEFSHNKTPYSCWFFCNSSSVNNNPKNCPN